MSVDQEPFWYLDRVRGGSPSDHVSHAFEITGPLRIDILENAFRLVIARHETLRSIFRETESGPRQIILPDIQWNLEFVDLSELPPAVMNENVDEVCKKTMLQFELDKGPLIRVVVIKRGEANYILLLAMHHIVSDGHSATIILSEISELYARQIRTDVDLSLNPSLQYQEFAARRNNDSSEQTGGNALKDLIDGLTASDLVLDLPAERIRAAIQSYAGARQHFCLSRREFENLRDYAKKTRISLFMLMVGVFYLLLQRYTGRDNILLGTPVSLRDSEELTSVVGLLLNTSVIKISASPAQSIEEFFRGVRKSVIEFLARQYVPIKDVVQQLNPPRDLNRNPVFQAMIQYSSLPEFELSGVETKYHEMDPGTSQFDLSLHLFECDSGLRGHFEYDTDLFDGSRMERAVGHFKAIITSLVEERCTTIGSLSLIGHAEQQLLRRWNATNVAYSDAQSVHDLFSSQVERTPDAIAAVCDGHQLTYRELEERANRLAHFLQRFGVARGVLVAICLHRSVEMLVGLLGILKAGGAYVPLDPDYPEDRLRYMLETAAVPVLLTQESLIGIVADYACERICVDRDWAMISRESQLPPAATLTPEDPAYVIFTSGSTGKPKGVQVQHRAVTNFLQSMAREPGMSGEDTLLAVTTLSFDIAVLELYLPLITGATVVVAQRDAIADGERLVDLIASHEVTMMQATPSTWRMLLLSGWQGGEEFKVLCGGEAFPRDLAGELLSRSGEVWNMYGPTETTVWSTCWRVRDAEQALLIGKPIANTKCYVLNESLQLAPIGVPGELYIGGAGVTLGYLNRDELTAERFIADPWHETDKLYRTGDLVRWRESGELEYLHRVDNQVKVRGYRIELEEIEAVLAAHVSVAQCVVMVRDYGPGDQRLIAYLVLVPGAEITVTEMRQQARTQLPDYMVPRHLIELDKLPLTPNGKVDRKTLPGISETFSNGERQLVEPATKAEVYLASVWRKALGETSIGVHDNFFDIGGHSLLAAQLVARVKSERGFDIPLRAMILNTLGQIANAYLEVSEAAGLPDSTSEIKGTGGSSGSIFTKILNVFSSRR